MKSKKLGSNSHKVLVTSSFGTEFPDCFRYDADGTLIIDGLPDIPGVYDHDKLSALNPKTQGINADESFGLATHATHKSRCTKVQGDAMSTAGDTFTFKGSENPRCEVPLTISKANQYKKP
jgi:hypothetical protein